MTTTRRILLVGIAIALSLATLGMRRDEARISPGPGWDHDQLARVQRQCLDAVAGPSTVVYEEDPAEAHRLVDQAGHAQLGDHAAGRPSQAWDNLMHVIGVRPEPSDLQSGVVFLHERFTPSGQRLLVYAAYRPSPTIEGRGELEVRVLGIDSLDLPPRELGRHVHDDFWLFYLWTRPAQQVLPHPGQHLLRLFAGQPDPSNRSQFSFGYEIDGMPGTMGIELLDPDPESDAPQSPRVRIFTSR